MNLAISNLIPRKIRLYFKFRTVKKEWKKLHKETKRKWKEDYERRKLGIEAEMKFKKNMKEIKGETKFIRSSSGKEGDKNGEIIAGYNLLEIYSNINGSNHSQDENLKFEKFRCRVTNFSRAIHNNSNFSYFRFGNTL
ncbi:hypothetical protein Glove_469g52 [Diversispora epigaea]|uniref:Uncharacterized protein n=1 Tax=Diversispora epigaea TaxID=1348612 RepID=A0A397GQA5_9GLOM|nr:hypothetical protein Glove_469g52 [Diversispora epigaea]